MARCRTVRLASAALGIVDYLRRGFARFNLRAHLLNLRGLLFELRREDSHSLLQLLDFAVFFEELIEQHRVHRFVAYRVRLALLVTHHEIRIHLFHLLDHQPKLSDAGTAAQVCRTASGGVQRQNPESLASQGMIAAFPH